MNVRSSLSSLRTGHCIMQLLAGVMILQATSAACAVDTCYGLAYGVVKRGHLYTVESTRECDQLYRRRIVMPNQPAAAAITDEESAYCFPTMASDLGDLRLQLRLVVWTIDRQYIWYTDLTRRNVGISCAEIRVPIDRALFTGGRVAGNARIAAIDAPVELWGPVRPGVDIDTSRFTEGSNYFAVVSALGPLHQAGPTRDTYFDVVPVNEREILAFISLKSRPAFLYPEFKGRHMVVFRFPFGAVHDTRLPFHFYWQGTWSVVGLMPTTIAQPFRATIVGGKYYFITESGKLYEAAAAGDEAHAEMKRLWPGSSHMLPIVALLRDADHSKSFAFTEAEYFELKDRIVLHPTHALKEGVAHTGGVMERLLRCAEVLSGAGIISDSNGK